MALYADLSLVRVIIPAADYFKLIGGEPAINVTSLQGVNLS